MTGYKEAAIYTPKMFVAFDVLIGSTRLEGLSIENWLSEEKQ
jgi:hypothetical protein